MPRFSAKFIDEADVSSSNLYPTPSVSPPPTLKRKRLASSEDATAPPNKKLRASPAGISHILQREFQAHLRGDRYKTKYHAEHSKNQALLHENDVLLERVKALEAAQGQLRARNEELEEIRKTSENVHEQTTRDIVEAREAAKEAQRQAEEYEERVRRDAEAYAQEYAKAYVQEHEQEAMNRPLADQAQTQVVVIRDDDELHQARAVIAQLQSQIDFLNNSLSTTSASLSSAQQSVASLTYSIAKELDIIQARYTRAIHGFAVYFYIKYPMDWVRIVRNFRPLAEKMIVGKVSDAYVHPDDVNWAVVPDRGEEEGEETTLERAEGGVEEEEEEEEDMEEDAGQVAETVQPQSSFAQQSTFPLSSSFVQAPQRQYAPQPLALGTMYDRARDPRLTRAADNFLDDMAGMLPGFGHQQSGRVSNAFGQASGLGAAYGSGFGQQSAVFGQSSTSAFGASPSTFVQQSAFGQPELVSAFGTPSALGQPSRTSDFGQTSSAFAQTAPTPSWQSAFGQPSTFCAPSSTSAFRQSSSQPAPAPSSSAFGQFTSGSTSVFQSSSSQAPTTSAFGRYTAGATSAFAQPQATSRPQTISAFGQSQAAPKPVPVLAPNTASPPEAVQRQPNSKAYDTSGYATE